MRFRVALQRQLSRKPALISFHLAKILMCSTVLPRLLLAPVAGAAIYALAAGANANAAGSSELPQASVATKRPVMSGGRRKHHKLPNCDADDTRCRILADKISRLNRRDPAAEAAQAAARGDFRLGAFNHIGPMPQGWMTVGVRCRDWSRELIGKWHVNQDVISAGDSEHTAASIAFLTAYNQSVVSDPRFPYPDICAKEGAKPVLRYTGVVRTATEAARSGDLAKLAAMSLATDVNARDEFESTALDWAMANGDEPMALALLERGADPNLHDPNEPSPLVQALNGKRFALAELMLMKGAKVPAVTNLCGRNDSMDPGLENTNRKCSGAGLLVAVGRFDLLELETRAGALDQSKQRAVLTEKGLKNPAVEPAVEFKDNFDEIRSSFFTALEAGDETLVRQLLPYVGRDEKAGSFLAELYKRGRRDLVRGHIATGNGTEAARSPAEAELWRAAAVAGHDDALAFLYDYGADLNLLPPAQLAECTAAPRAGAVDRLLACMRAAGERRVRLQAALANADVALAGSLIAEAGDVRERNKLTLLSRVAGARQPALLRRLLARGAPVGGSGHGWLNQARVYTGSLKADAEAMAVASGYSQALAGSPNLVRAAAMNNDSESLRVLVDAGAPGLVDALVAAGNLGNPPKGLRDMMEQDDDSENLPNSPGPESLRGVDLLASEIARAHGPQALDRAFSSAVYSGYNDVLELLIARGYDARQAREPWRIWHNWSGLSQPCKPSTGRLLLRAGLPTKYPPNDYTRSGPLHGLAAGCRNPRSVAVLAEAVGVNEVDADGDTPVDVAIRYNRQKLADALRLVGGKPASALNPTAFAQRQQQTREENDLDLVQSEAQ